MREEPFPTKAAKEGRPSRIYKFYKRGTSVSYSQVTHREMLLLDESEEFVEVRSLEMIVGSQAREHRDALVCAAEVLLADVLQRESEIERKSEIKRKREKLRKEEERED